MACNVLYGMAPCFGHTGVTFDAENDRPGPGSLRGHFEDARGHMFETEGFVGREGTGGPPQELYRRETASIYIYSNIYRYCGFLLYLTLGAHVRSEGYCSCPVFVCACYVVFCHHAHLDPEI